MKRRITCEPPERKSSTLMPVSVSNALTILLAVEIGVEVYQTTLPSFLAAAASTGSPAQAGAATPSRIAQVKASMARLCERVIGFLRVLRPALRVAGRAREDAQVGGIEGQRNGVADRELEFRRRLRPQRFARRERDEVFVNIAEEGAHRDARRHRRARRAEDD